MIHLTYGTVGALVASHTGTSIVIYSVGTICTVFTRIRVTVVDVCKKRNKWWKICNLHSNSSVYVQIIHFLHEKKTASNFVLEKHIVTSL